MTAQNAANRGIRRAASQANYQAQLDSFKKVVRYCETTDRCRHDMIKELFGDFELERMRAHGPPGLQSTITDETNDDDDDDDDKPSSASPCDYACDVCKEGSESVAGRKSKMVAESRPEDFMDMDMGMASIMQAMYPRAFPSRGYGHPANPFCHECS